MTEKNDFKITNKSVQHNDLITSMWKMNMTVLKLFEMTVSCIDVNNPPVNNTIFIDKKDIFNLFGVSSSDKYTRFSDHVLKLQSQVIIFNNEVSKRNKKTTISPFSKIEWFDQDDDGTVMFKFGDDIMPYLIDLKLNFTQYEISNLMNLRGKYSIILYKLAKMSKWKGNNFNISVEELRRITDTINEYERWANFEMRVIQEPIEQINYGYTDIIMKYMPVKKGRSIVSVDFFVRKRLSYNDHDYDNPIDVGPSDPIGGQTTIYDFE